MLSGHLGQVDFLDGQVTFKAHLPIGQDSRQDILQLKYVDQYATFPGIIIIYPWFKFYFPLFQTHYHSLPYPKTKGNKI